MPDLDDGDLYDGRHLTAEGHAEIAAAWFDALAEGLRIAGGDLLGERRAIAPDVRDLVGSERGDHLRGDANANRIDGGGGNDRIEGGLGADVLTGGPGNDVFVFRTRAEGGDTIVDFTPGADLLEFDDQAFGIAAGTRPLLRAAAEPTAQGTSAQFLYDTTDGRLLWDGDGTGAGARVLVATLAGSPAITAEDFLVI
jgi:Ca2+-binding RTX toxin-like protein